MSKMNLGLTAIMLSGVALISALSPSAARAQSDGGAVVYHACPTEYGEISFGGYDFEYCFDSTETPNGTANASFHGHLVDRTTAPKKAVTLTAIPCYAGNGFTYDSELTITPSGQIHGICKNHN